MKKITIETSTSKEYFEIDESDNKYLVFKLDYNNFWSNKNRTKIGDSKTFEDAIAIAKSSVSGSIRKVIIG